MMHTGSETKATETWRGDTITSAAAKGNHISIVRQRADQSSSAPSSSPSWNQEGPKQHIKKGKAALTLCLAMNPAPRID